MVVITIIGILSTVVLSSLQQARLKVLDAKRLSEIRQVQNALELYLQDFGQYPPSDNNGTGGWDTPAGGGPPGMPFIGVLTTGGYMAQIKDPTTNNLTGNYRYYRYPPGTYDPDGPGPLVPCDPSRGGYYVIEIINFDVSTPSNPGFSCPGGRDWTVDGKYVVGKFENWLHL